MRKHEPTEETKATVSGMAAMGVPQEQIAGYLGIDPKTLRLHYRDELNAGKATANFAVAKHLYKSATGNGPQSVTAAIFWAKTQMGWKDTTAVEHSGPNGGPIQVEAESQYDFSLLDPEEQLQLYELLAKCKRPDPDAEDDQEEDA